MSYRLTKDDSIIRTLIAEYCQFTYKTSDPTVAKSESYISPSYCGYDWGDFRRIKSFSRRRKYKVTDIVPIHNERIMPCSFGVPAISHNRLTYDKRQGVWRVEMSDGTCLYYACYQKGLRGEVVRICVTEERVWKVFLKLYNEYNSERKKKLALPKSGVYDIAMTPGGIEYREKKDYPISEVIHPSVQPLVSDADYFYSHVHLFTRHKQRGVRKILIVGKPGTGKTSIGYRLADTYAKNMPVVFADGFAALYNHLESCSQYDVSTLAFVNDVEGSLRDGGTFSNSESQVLNFMDGTNLPNVKKGAYCIFTTNFPEKIQSRYVRPGRIDKIIPWGPLEGTYSAQCAEFYLQPFFIPITEQIRKDFQLLFDGMTGAEIRMLAQMCEIRSCQDQRPSDISLLRELKVEFEEVQKILEGAAKTSTFGNYV